MLNNTTWPISDISIPRTLNSGESARGNSILLASHVIIVVLAPVTVVGNAVVLTAIWKKSFQRTPFHILLSVLAFTDLCNGVVSPLMSIPYLHDHKFGTVSKIGILSETYLVDLTILLITIMSIERWLHMTRRSLVTSRRGCLIAAISLLVPIPFAVFQASYFFRERFKLEAGIAMGAHMLSCYLATSVAYFKVFRIIRQHQQQIRGSQSCQSVGQPAIDLAKYKKSVISILYILALFSVCFLPTTVTLFVLVLLDKSKATWEPYHVAIVFLFLSSALNPGLYIWRMKDVRDGVKSLFRKNGSG